jgi:hypothetical protein
MLPCLFLLTGKQRHPLPVETAALPVSATDVVQSVFRSDPTRLLRSFACLADVGADENVALVRTGYCLHVAFSSLLSIRL